MPSYISECAWCIVQRPKGMRVYHGLLPFLGVTFQDTQTDCVQDTAQRMKLKRLKASTALMTRQTDAEQRRPTIKKLEVKQVEFKLGEDCWDIQDKRLDGCPFVMMGFLRNNEGIGPLIRAKHSSNSGKSHDLVFVVQKLSEHRCKLRHVQESICEAQLEVEIPKNFHELQS
ncbi:hypothetical protein Tco_0596913 [Tanacetum coccineum]